MRILIACEESDTVRSRFEKLGFDAWSCDIQPSRNKNAKHLQTDLMQIINDDWDVIIAFPPCTHLAVSGAAWFEQKKKDGRQQAAIDFFLKIANASIKHIAIENPIGIMGKIYKKPTQIIQPYYFGDHAQKTTCLWLKNLPLLYHNEKPNLFDSNVTHVDKGKFKTWICSKTGRLKKQPLWIYEAALKNNKNSIRGKIRSKTFDGIAEAMANQWGNYLINLYNLKQKNNETKNN